MCTASNYITKDHYFGRNFDYEISYNERVTVTPRNYKFEYRLIDDVEIVNFLDAGAGSQREILMAFRGGRRADFQPEIHSVIRHGEIIFRHIAFHITNALAGSVIEQHREHVAIRDITGNGNGNRSVFLQNLISFWAFCHEPRIGVRFVAVCVIQPAERHFARNAIHAGNNERVKGLLNG